MGRAGLMVLLSLACTEEPRILSLSIHGDTRDTVGPYVIETVARDLGEGDQVSIYYRTSDDAPFSSLWGRAVGSRDDLFAAEIPGQPGGTMIRYYAAVLRGERIFVEHRPSADGYWSFRVLGLSATCRVDSDCLTGREICAANACRAFDGACVGLECPDGYVCDQDREPRLCVIAPRPCATDLACPSVERCDPDRAACVPRAACEDTADCLPGETCQEQLGLCFDSAPQGSQR